MATTPKASSPSTGSGQAKSMAELMARASSQFSTLKRGDIVTGIVKKLEPREILLDIGYKSDALVIEYDKQNLENLLGILKIGDKVTASVISPESEEGFPVLSLRRMLEEKVYGALETVFKADTALVAHVLEVTRGGYFIETNEGIKGFLPNSQLRDSRINQGDKVEVKVIEFDREKKRVIVSQKAMHYLMNIPEIEKHIKRDSVVKGVVTLVTSYGIYLEISPKEGILIEGFIHISEVSHQRVEGLEGKFKIGEKLDVQVIGVDIDNKRVNLSLKRLEKDTFEDVKKKYKKEDTISGTVTDVKTKGITLQIEPTVMAFISASKIPTGTEYKKDDKVEVEITDFDDKKRLIIVSPVLKTKVITYR
ncbi:MAG: S1 RNA-binding domain-containing protein [Candidatus Levybacteria bacterium]|nr:S1 RNA-binding domain-containing protein [Candidatus Levybacteria bacterium]